MSLALMLHKQSLLAQRNNLEAQSISNSRSEMGMLNSPSFMGNSFGVAKAENAIDLENTSNESQLMAINAELNAINTYRDNSGRLNFLA